MMKSICYVAFLASIIAVSTADLNLRTREEQPRAKRGVRGGKMSKRHLRKGGDGDRELSGILTYHSKKYHGHGVLDSKRRSKAHHYWRTDSRDFILWPGALIPLLPIGVASLGVASLGVAGIGVATTVAFTSSQCGSCNGGFLQNADCDCACFCLNTDPDLIPVILDPDNTDEPEPDIPHPDSNTCGCESSNNFPPVATSDSFFTEVNTVLNFNPVDNDIDVNNKPLTILNFDQPDEGNVVENFDGSLTYTPTDDFQGVVSFTYIISNDGGDLGEGTTTIVVGNPNGISGITTQAVPISFEPSEILGTVSDLTELNDVDTADNGSISIQSDGSILYTPNPDFVGTDNFEFTVLDSNGNPSILSGSILVQPSDEETDQSGSDLGVLSLTPQTTPDSFNININTEKKFEPVEIIWNDSGNELELTSVLQPQQGSIIVSSDMSFIYTPRQDHFGSDSFSYIVTDSMGETAVGQVSILVNRPPIANDVDFTITPGNEIIITKDQLLENDFDPDGNVIEIHQYDLVSKNGGTISKINALSYEYIPKSGFQGSDSFDYYITDNHGGFGRATVTIIVADTLDAKVDNYSIEHYTMLTVSAPGVLGNDLGYLLKVIEVSSPSEGGFIDMKEDGSFTYMPNDNWEGGTETITYNIVDYKGDSDTAILSIAVGLCQRYTTDTLLDQNYAINCQHADSEMQGHFSENIELLTAPARPTQP